MSEKPVSEPKEAIFCQLKLGEARCKSSKIICMKVAAAKAWDTVVGKCTEAARRHRKKVAY